MKKIFIIMAIVLIIFSLTKAKPISESLLFVGEDTHILTVASGRPEFPERAPAVATVITKKTIEERGYRTLWQILQDIPGFLTLEKEYGHTLISRGLPSGALFLYDGVPFTTDSTKSIYPLDEELNLSYVKRVEFVRGPGSILWGPDAFAGVINVVPLEGKDINGFKIEALHGVPLKDNKFSLTFGKYLKGLDFMFSGSHYAKENSHGGYKQEFTEFISRLKYKNFLKLNLRISNYHNPSKMKFENIKWKSYREKPSFLIECELTKKFSHTSVKLKGYYLFWNIKHKEENFSWGYDNEIFYGEFSLTKDLFNNNGLFVGGVSIKRNISKNASVNIRSFYPEYLKNKYLEPLVEKRNFDTTLTSIFGQYTHHLKNFEFWAGLRYDKHTDYKSSVTYNIGIAWFPKKWLILKTLYGIAYRTPFASQFLKKHAIDPEKIETFNFNVSLKRKHLFGEVTLFHSKVKKHISEDPYGGYSEPSKQYFTGIEVYTELKFKKFKSWLSFTGIHHQGEKEKFKVLDYILIFPPEIDFTYSIHKRTFESGPSFLWSCGFTYEPFHKFLLSFVTRYQGPFNYSNLKTSKRRKIKHFWTSDLNLSYKIRSGLSLNIKVENLFNQKRKIPGTFSLIKGTGTRFYISLNAKF